MRRRVRGYVGVRNIVVQQEVINYRHGVEYATAARDQASCQETTLHADVDTACTTISDTFAPVATSAAPTSPIVFGSSEETETLRSCASVRSSCLCVSVAMRRERPTMTTGGFLADCCVVRSSKRWRGATELSSRNVMRPRASESCCVRGAAFVYLLQMMLSAVSDCRRVCVFC